MLFEKATRKQFRFPSAKGDLNVEQVWQLPLTSRSGFDLDTVAQTINAELKTMDEASFVKTHTSPKKGELQDKLEILKHIIRVKQEEATAAEDRVRKSQELDRLQSLLADKKDAALAELSVEELQARIDSLK